MLYKMLRVTFIAISLSILLFFYFLFYISCSAKYVFNAISCIKNLKITKIRECKTVFFYQFLDFGTTVCNIRKNFFSFFISLYKCLKILIVQGYCCFYWLFRIRGCHCSFLLKIKFLVFGVLSGGGLRPERNFCLSQCK